MNEYQVSCLGKVRFHRRAYAKKQASRTRLNGPTPVEELTQ